MTSFDYRTETIDTPFLKMEYFLVPWDTDIVGRPVAEISRLQVAGPEKAATAYLHFARWCEDQHVTLCSCRLDHDQIVESMFLEDRGFRFIELNYRPRLTGLQALEVPEDNLMIEVASEKDRERLADIAANAFHHGRFHQDPRLGPDLGNRRYRTWLENAFSRTQQKVLKCSRDGEIVGLFVVEYPEADHCFWALSALAPGLQGHGLGKRVWRARLRWHQAEGVDTITTSISSHNVAAFNLCVSTGFRFPKPLITLHWRPAGTPAVE